MFRYDKRIGDPHHHSHMDDLPELKGDVGSHAHDEEFHKGKVHPRNIHSVHI